MTKYAVLLSSSDLSDGDELAVHGRFEAYSDATKTVAIIEKAQPGIRTAVMVKRDGYWVGVEGGEGVRETLERMLA